MVATNGFVHVRSISSVRDKYCAGLLIAFGRCAKNAAIELPAGAVAGMVQVMKGLLCSSGSLARRVRSLLWTGLHR
jgi:hypothetical protein